MARKPQPVADRLAAFTDRSSPDGCWPWLGSCDMSGYGKLKVGGRTERAHRLAWLLTYGPPGEQHVLHHCDNRRCVRPDHLFLGTHQDNMADLATKRRVAERQSSKPKARGTAREHKGVIELSAYAGVDPATGRKQKLYDTRPLGTPPKEVDVALTALVAKADALIAARGQRAQNPYAPDPVPSADTSRTVGDALEAWWDAHGRHLAGGNERGLMDAYLIPGLGAVQLWRLRTIVDPARPGAGDLVDLTKFFAELKPITIEAFRPDTIERIHGVLRGALAREVGPGGLESNPAVGVKLPTGDTRESTTPDADQMAAFFKFLATPRILPAYTATRRVRETAKTVTYEVPARMVDEDIDATLRAYARLVMSGPRPQEVSALRRGNYDRTNGRLKLLAEGIVREKKKGEPEQWVHRRGETVKRRPRTLVLDAATREAVAEMMDKQDERAKVYGATLSRRSYLFTDEPDGAEPINPKVASRGFDRAVKRAVAAGVDVPEGMRLYDCRHFGITRLVQARRDIPTIARRYATSAEMIYRVYAHGEEDDLADDLGGWG